MRSQLSAVFLLILAGVPSPSWSFYIILDDEKPPSTYVVQEEKKVAETPIIEPVRKEPVTVIQEILPSHHTDISIVPEIKPNIANKKVVRRYVKRSCPNTNACSKENVRAISFTVPFAKRTSALSQEAILQLVTLLPQIAGAKVCIVGRPDVHFRDKNYISTLASNRAKKIREYLTLNGVPMTSISLSYSNTPNPPLNGGLMSSDITIYAPIQDLSSGVTPNSSSLKPKNRPASPLIQSSSNPGKNQIIEYIATAYTAGQIAPDVALDLLKLIQSAHISDSQSHLKRM